jgi:VIT1/CCC1 family predicted Fe2+/Mn2+ transporter
MDTEEEINNAAEKIMRDITVSKLDALNMLLGRYQSQKRLEEAVIVQRIIEKEKTKPEDYGHGIHQDM